MLVLFEGGYRGATAISALRAAVVVLDGEFHLLALLSEDI